MLWNYNSLLIFFSTMSLQRAFLKIRVRLASRSWVSGTWVVMFLGGILVAPWTAGGSSPQAGATLRRSVSWACALIV